MTETMQIKVNKSSQGKGSLKRPASSSLCYDCGLHPYQPSGTDVHCHKNGHVDSKVSVQTHFSLCQTHLVKGFVIALFISCLNWNVKKHALRIKPRVPFVPHGCHSWNFLLVDTARSSVETIIFFGVFQ